MVYFAVALMTAVNGLSCCRIHDSNGLSCCRIHDSSQWSTPSSFKVLYVHKNVGLIREGKMGNRVPINGLSCCRIYKSVVCLPVAAIYQDTIMGHSMIYLIRVITSCPEDDPAVDSQDGYLALAVIKLYLHTIVGPAMFPFCLPPSQNNNNKGNL